MRGDLDALVAGASAFSFAEPGLNITMPPPGGFFVPPRQLKKSEIPSRLKKNARRASRRAVGGCLELEPEDHSIGSGRRGGALVERRIARLLRRAIFGAKDIVGP